VAGRVTAGQSLLTALAGLTAYQAGLPAGELLALGAGEPGESFAAAVGIAALLAEEVRRLGGDPDVILRGVYDKASSLAYS
jgi:hypothetical protein